MIPANDFLTRLVKKCRTTRTNLRSRKKIRSSAAAVSESLEDKTLLAAVGFQFGIEDNGGLGIRNTSSNNRGTADGDLFITRLTIDLRSDPDGTFFDTTNSSPGNASRGWSTASSNTFSTNLPSNSATDGQRYASMTFSGFGPGEDGRIFFDLDRFGDIDGTGRPAGGTVTVTFGSGETITSTITTTDIWLDGQTFDNRAIGSRTHAAPRISVFSNPSSGVGYDDAPTETLGWSISGSTSRSIQLRRPSGAVVSSSGSSSGSFGLSSSLIATHGLGTYTTSVTAYNRYGDISTASDQMLIRDDDTAAPTVTFLSPSTQSQGGSASGSFRLADADTALQSMSARLYRGTTGTTLAAPPRDITFSTSNGGGPGTYTSGFNMSSLTPGVYRLQVTATDSDLDRGSADSLSRTATQFITIVNGPPVITAMSLSSSSIDENGTVTVTGSFSDRGLNDQHTVLINWGDGTSSPAVVTQGRGGGSFRATKVYRDDGPSPGNGTLSDRYLISATVTDNYGQRDVESRTLTVNNVAPIVSGVAVTNSIDEGGTAFLTGTIADPGSLDTFTMVVDWGDGSAPETVQIAAGSDFFSVPHTYIDDDPSGSSSDTYDVRILSFTDDNGGTADIGTVGGGIVLDAYQRGWWNAEGTHFSTNDNTYTGNWAGLDYNSYFTFNTTGLPAASSVVLRLELESWTGQDAFQRVGVYDVTTDAQTLEGSARTRRDIYLDLQSGARYGVASMARSELGSVIEIPLSAQAVSDLNASGGSFSVGINLETNSAAYDGIRFSGGSESREHQVKIGLVAVPSVTVNNVAPVTSPLTLSESVIDEDGSVTVTGSFSDVGVADTHTVTIDWGDGNTTTADVSQGAGTGTFTATYSYPDDGVSPGNGTPSDVYTITATVTDDDGGSSSVSADLTVENVAPVVTNVAVTSPVNEGDVATLTGDIADPGSLDSFTMVIDWGDGTAPETVSLAAGSTSFSIPHTYVDDDPTGSSSDTYDIRILSFTDDDGGEAAVGTGGETAIEASDRGWWNGLGAHSSRNDNTFTGTTGRPATDYNAYFTFDTTGITAASDLLLRLELENYYGQDAAQTISVFDVATDADTLEASGSGRQDIYEDLQSGIRYGALPSPAPT